MYKLTDFKTYVEEKYTYIEKLDLLRSEKGTWKMYGLSSSQVITIWNELYKIN